MEARYVRVTNLKQLNKGVKFSELQVQRSSTTEYTRHVYSNVEVGVESQFVDESLTKLLPKNEITLNEGEYIGVRLDRIKDLSNIDVEVSNMDGLKLQTSMNTIEWTDVEVGNLKDARYIRLIADKTVTFDLAKLDVTSNEVYKHSLVSAYTNSCSKPEAAFDGDLTTVYKPNTNNGQIKSGSLTYCISEKTDIKKINIVQSGSAISNAKVMVRTGVNEAGEEVWNQIGKLDKSLNEIVNTKYDNIFEIKIEWKGNDPTIYELVTINDYEVPNITDLEELIASCTYEEEKYTVGSFKNYIKALKEANKVLANEDATEEEVSNAVKSIQRSMDGLIASAGDGNNNNGGSGNNGGSNNNESGNNNNSNNNNGGKLPQTGGTPAAEVGLFGLLTAAVGTLLRRKNK